MKSKNLLILLMIGLTLTYASCSDYIGWTDHLGNPQRTGYSSCTGPDMPEVFWKMDTSGAFDTSPFIIGDKVLILWNDSQYHTLTAKVIILDLLTGEVLYDIESLLFSEVFPVDGRIIGRSGKNLYETNIAAGTSTLIAEIPDRPYAVNQYPVILENKIVIPTYPPLCLTFDFDIVWDMENTEIYPNLLLYNLAGDENTLGFIVVEEGVTQLLVVDPSIGTIEWMSDPLPLSLWLTIGDDTLYCGGENLWAFDRKGSEQWSFFPKKRIISNIVLGPDALFFADEANTLYKIDLNGNLVWKTDWEASPWYYETHLIGAGDILYCVGNYGTPDFPSRSSISAYNMEDGSELWDMELDPPTYIRAPPAVTEGILLFGTVDGAIIALASDPELFVKQGDTFLSEGYTEKAINSYKKAAELYEQKEDLSRSEEMQKRIHELETPSESPPETIPPATPPETSPSTPQTTPETSPESTLPPTQESSLLIPLSVVLIGAVIGIFVAYYIINHKKIQK